MEALQLPIPAFNHVSANLSLGTTSTYTTTVTTTVSINGRFGTTLGAQTNTASPTTDARTGLAFPALAPNQAVALVWGINLAGAIQLCQGPITPTEIGVTTTPGALILNPSYPMLPDDFAPLAYTVVRTAPNLATFIAGTTSWTAAGGVATTTRNVSQLPARPQV